MSVLLFGIFRHAVRIGGIAAVAAVALSASVRGETVVNLEDLPLAAGTYWNGSDGSGGFVSNGVSFNNFYASQYGSWSGWSYSSVSDKTTAGFGNQYAAYGQGSGNYAVCYDGSAFDQAAMLTIPDGMQIQSIMVANTTYAYLSMRDGDAYAKKFGGTSGNDPDYFLLTITGKNSAGGAAGQVDFYLADYRFANNAQDTLIADWTRVDLAALANAKTLEFTLSSSDNGDWGMNTPGFFAVDNLTLSAVPEPASLALLVCGLACGAAVWTRRRLAK